MPAVSLAAWRSACKGDVLNMPAVFRYKGYSFFFFSNERDLLEPIHIHVRRGEVAAKLWMLPQVSLAEQYERC